MRSRSKTFPNQQSVYGRLWTSAICPLAAPRCLFSGSERRGSFMLCLCHQLLEKRQDLLSHLIPQQNRVGFWSPTEPTIVLKAFHIGKKRLNLRGPSQ